MKIFTYRSFAGHPQHFLFVVYRQLHSLMPVNSVRFSRSNFSMTAAIWRDFIYFRGKERQYSPPIHFPKMNPSKRHHDLFVQFSFIVSGAHIYEDGGYWLCVFFFFFSFNFGSLMMSFLFYLLLMLNCSLMSVVRCKIMLH